MDSTMKQCGSTLPIMHTGPPDRLLLAVCNYNMLEKADRQTGGQHSEEWLINLQNHLIWGTFIPNAESFRVVQQGIIDTIQEDIGFNSDLPMWALGILENNFFP